MASPVYVYGGKVVGRTSGGFAAFGIGGGGGSNPIDAARRTDWTQAGANIVNRTTQSGSTIAAYSGTSATIQNALAAAADSTVVVLGGGTFTISNALNMGQGKKVTLRGQGPGVTILKFTGDGGTVWPWTSCPITIAGNPAYTADAIPPVVGASGSAVAVSGTGGSSAVYTKNATVLNLGGSHSYVVGDTGVLVQDDYPDASLPRAGFFASTKQDHSGSTANGIAWQGAYEDFGAVLQQRFVVTAVSGNDITISPGLVHGFYQSSLNPRVYRFAASSIATSIGLENLTVDTTSLGTEHALIGMIRARDCWVKNVAIKPNPTAGGDYGIAITDSHSYSVVNNWIDAFAGGGGFTTTSYGVSLQCAHWGVIANNIFNQVEQPVTINIGCVGNAVLYNYENWVSGEGGFDHHQPGCCYNLFEGNSVLKMSGDLFHGNSMVETCFRNLHTDRGYDLQSYFRYWNILGAVIQASVVRKTTVLDANDAGTGGGTNRWASFGFRFGYPGQDARTNTQYNGGSLIGVAGDTDVNSTAFLWFNYTTTGGTQSNSSECPTADGTLPQAVPADNSIPNSMFYTSIPSYFTIAGVGTVAWPCIGPDVTGGDVTGYGGHANKTPAQRMYEFCSGVISNFNPSLFG